jgi:hypothetical protein
MEYSKDTELCNFGSDPDPLCIYFLCTRHTKGMDKATISTNELLNNYGWSLVEKLPLHILLQNYISVLNHFVPGVVLAHSGTPF